MKNELENIIKEHIFNGTLQLDTIVQCGESEWGILKIEAHMSHKLYIYNIEMINNNKDEYINLRIIF